MTRKALRYGAVENQQLVRHGGVEGKRSDIGWGRVGEGQAWTVERLRVRLRSRSRVKMRVRVSVRVECEGEREVISAGAGESEGER